MTDPTGQDSTPTTNENLGVIGAGLAAEEARRNADTPVDGVAQGGGDDRNLRREVLQLAIQTGGATDVIVDRAQQYLDFLKGNSDG